MNENVRRYHLENHKLLYLAKVRVSIKEEKTVESSLLEERYLFIVDRVVRIIDFSVWWPN